MKTMTIDEFKKMSYDAHETLWLLRHGFSAAEILKRLTDHAVVELREMPIKNQSNATHVRAFMDSLSDCLWMDWNDAGCVCEKKEEFLKREFLDPIYMEKLFGFIWPEEEKDSLLTMWSQVTGISLPEKEEKLEVKTPAGAIRAYKNTEPEQPGVTVMVLPDGYEDEIDAAEVCVCINQMPGDVVINVWDDATRSGRSYQGIISREDIFYGPGSSFERAWRVGEHGYLHLQSCDTGWDYTLYGPDYEEIDGGQVDDIKAGPLTVRDQILSDRHWASASDSLTDVDPEELLEKAEEAN